MTVIAYTYDAAMHCVGCARHAFSSDMPNGIDPGNALDREGNPVHPVFSWDETSRQGENCDTCGGVIAAPYDAFVVLGHTPGYLSEDDDPATYDTYEDAVAGMREELARYLETDETGERFTVEEGIASNYAAVVIHDSEKMHDLGYVIEVLSNLD